MAERRIEILNERGELKPAPASFAAEDPERDDPHCDLAELLFHVPSRVAAAHMLARLISRLRS